MPDTAARMKRWDESRKQFAQMLKNWRHQNDWPMRTSRDWAEACPEILPVCVLDSTWTGLEAGRNQRTAPVTFLALGVQNEALAREDRGTITNRQLRARVYAAEPIRHPDGTPWNDGDFYACFTGRLSPPASLLHRSISREEAGDQSERWRNYFRSQAVRKGLSPVAAFRELATQADDALSPRQRERLEEVLLGFSDFEPEELSAMGNGGLLLPEYLLRDWAESDPERE